MKKHQTQFLFLSALILWIAEIGTQPLAREDQKKNSAPPAKVRTASLSVTKAPTYSTSKAPAPSVTEIQRELQEIIRIHQSLQQQHYTQIREIQRITEQAKAHQKILEDLARVRKVAAARPPVTNLDEMIRLQKIDLIQQEARKNRAILEEVEKQASEEKKKSTQEKEKKKSQ